MKIKSDQISKLNVQHDRLGVEASSQLIDALDASIDRLGLSADFAQINKLSVAIELGEFLITRFFKDGVTISDMSTSVDEFVMHFFKTLTDEAGVAENATLIFTKAMNEVGLTTDALKMDFFKALVDSAGVADHYYASLLKPFSDEFSAAEDSAFILTKKVKEDIAGAVDEINQFIFSKALLETPAFAEQHAVALQRGYDDDFGVSEKRILHPNKVRSDQSSVSDSLDKIHVGKGLNDTSTLVDSLALNLSRYLQDNAGLSDAYAATLTKVLTDDVTGLEDHAFILTKKVKEDIAGVDEWQWRTIGKPFADESTVADENQLHAGKIVVDTAAFTDTAKHLTTKVLTDVVNATDDFDGAASIEDDQEMTFTKQRNDAAGVAESIYINMQWFRDFADTSKFTDDQFHNFTKVLAEQPVLEEHHEFNLSKPLSDDSDITDTTVINTTKPLADSTAITDVRRMTYKKVLGDVVLGSDSFGLLRNRARGYSETAALSDTGRIISQGYVSDAYYFQDDFVGSSRTF